MSEKRVVITGLGLINAIGDTVDESWNNCINGVCGIKEVKSVNTAECYAHMGAEASKNFDVDANKDFFLWHIGHKYEKLHDTKGDGSGTYVCNCSLWGDDQYVKELKAYMVEQTESEPFEPVPTSWQAPVWLTPVCG